MKFRLLTAASALAFLSITAPAHASLITYTLSNVGLTYGVGGVSDGTLNGSFVINTANPVATELVSLNITASASTGTHAVAGSGFDYIYGLTGANSTVVASTSTALDLWAGGGAEQLNLAFLNALGSGTDGFNGITAETESSTIGVRNIGSGFSATVGSVAATPEPSSLALLGTGMASIGAFIRRRRKA